MTLALTRSIGRFIEDLTFDQIPAGSSGHRRDRLHGLHRLRHRRPRRSRWCASSSTRCRRESDRGEATSHRCHPRLRPGRRARNGVACHVLDYDDVALFGHPSVVLVPAILAEGEAIGVTGRDAVCAYSLATRSGAT